MLLEELAQIKIKLPMATICPEAQVSYETQVQLLSLPSFHLHCQAWKISTLVATLVFFSACLGKAKYDLPLKGKQIEGDIPATTWPVCYSKGDFLCSAILSLVRDQHDYYCSSACWTVKITWEMSVKVNVSETRSRWSTGTSASASSWRASPLWQANKVSCITMWSAVHPLPVATPVAMSSCELGTLLLPGIQYTLTQLRLTSCNDFQNHSRDAQGPGVMLLFVGILPQHALWI